MTDGRAQIERCREPLFWAYLAGVLLFGFVLLLKFRYGIPTKYFLYDPSELDELVSTVPLPPSFAGLVSSIGIVLWGVAAGIALFSLLLTRSDLRGIHRTSTEATRKASDRFLLGFALISILFLLDDLLTLHEAIARNTILTEAVVQAFLALLLVGFLLLCRHSIRHGEWLPLGIALTLFAGSVLIDVALLFPGKILVEDGLKFFGILSWVVFIVIQGRELIGLEGSEP